MSVAWCDSMAVKASVSVKIGIIHNTMFYDAVSPCCSRKNSPIYSERSLCPLSSANDRRGEEAIDCVGTALCLNGPFTSTTDGNYSKSYYIITLYFYVPKMFIPFK